MDRDGPVRCDSCPVSREQLVLTFIRESMNFADRVDANVGAGI